MESISHRIYESEDLADPAAVKEADNAVALIREPLIVGDHDDSCLFLIIQALQYFHNFATHVAVQVAGGFVGQQDFG
jgi:hypothetical protein